MKEFYLNIEKQKFTKAKYKRTFFVKFFVLFIFLILFVRLVQIQVFKANDLRAVAISQYSRPSIIPASRGKIYDRNKNVLASSMLALKIAADPKVIKPEGAVLISDFLSEISNRQKNFYLSMLNSEKKYVCLEKELLPIYRDEILKLNIKGLIVEEVQKRLYHYGPLAGQVLGGVDLNNNGNGGVEKFFNEDLKGVDGKVINYRDGRREIKRVIDFPKIEPKNGNNIYLTIDLTFQSIVEEELKRGVEKFSADIGTVIVMNPKTGEILALAQYPEFDPSSYDRENVVNNSIRAVTDAVEPGSMFKIVTAAAALESKKVNPDQLFYAEKGKYKCPVGKKSFVLITDSHPYDYLTFQQAMEASSNIVFAKISYIVGKELIYKKARDMGFGVKTGIELPGETRGVLKHPNQWSGSTLQAMSRGYEVQTSPLQIITAFASIANKGILVKPYIVKKIVNQNSEVVFENQPIIIRRVMSESNARILTEMLASVVEGKQGTAKLAYINGLRIAGKTGTARKLVNKKYSTENLLASFVGYFPVEDPKVVCLVMLHNPKIDGKISGMGGNTSALIFKAIAERIRTSTNLFETTSVINYAYNFDTSTTIKLMDFRNLSRTLVENILEKYPLKIKIVGDGPLIIDQSPQPYAVVQKNSEIKLFCNLNNENTGNLIKVPNVIGLPIKKAVNVLIAAGLDVSIHGSGIVTSQSPEAGVEAAKNTIVSLFCGERKLTEAYK